MIGQAIAVVGIIGMIFFAGVQYAKNRIQHNMMSDLVEIDKMQKWLRVWT